VPAIHTCSWKCSCKDVQIYFVCRPTIESTIDLRNTSLIHGPARQRASVRPSIAPISLCSWIADQPFSPHRHWLAFCPTKSGVIWVGRQVFNAVLVYRVLHGLSPSYLNNFAPLSIVSGRSNLRSAVSHRLLVPRCRLSTICNRTFPVAGASVWNDLPMGIASSPSLNILRSRLETFLFGLSFPGAVV
jgi:hypothetical protein